VAKRSVPSIPLSTPPNTILRVTRGYNNSLLLQYGELSGSFYRGVRTLTGLRDKHGRCRGLTSSQVFAMLRQSGIDKRLLAKPYDFVEFESDSWGFFGHMDTRDVLEAAERDGYMYTITLPLGIIARLANRGS